VTTSRALLAGEALDAAVADLEGWEVKGGKLHKEYVFADFVEAFGFMAGAALCAERRNHHPEWSNVYRTVCVDLSTHDAGGITMWDVELAKDFDQVARRS
jgi:4a-hydroxytetrahydrobiopterin dehydratase